ncbi:hypothetical protein LJB42_001489 [Komagataella kurtzmanii]|nr:hypothetical protein LJB42_001489 [Komagataella kurtzmanii]
MATQVLVIDSVHLDEDKQIARNRSVPWTIYVKSRDITEDEVSKFKVLEKKGIEDKIAIIGNNKDSYATTIVNLLNRTTKDDIIRLLSVLTNDLLIELDGFQESLLALNKIDSSLPYAAFSKYLNSPDQVVSLLSSYNLTLLFVLQDKTQLADNLKDTTPFINELYQYLFEKLLSNDDINLQFIGAQLLKELLSVKIYRDLFWNGPNKWLKDLLNLFENTTPDLQLKYYALLSVWLLTFNKDIVNELPNQHPEIVPLLLNIAKESVKEKLVRVAVSSLLNLVSVDNNEAIVKVVLLHKGLITVKKLNERKWTDEELKVDLENLLTVVNETVITLTTFDEYENELKTGKLTWSPAHKAEQFWIDNSAVFKEQNWKHLKTLLSLLEGSSDLEPSQKYLNQAIVCHDVAELLKHLPESLDVLNKLGAKAKIMALLNSPDANVKYEALNATQTFVSLVFNH